MPLSSALRPVPMPAARSWPRKLALGFLTLCLLTSGVYAFRAPLLRSAARAWIVNDPVAKADAIVVLGGGLEYRPFAAARLYTNGCAKTILIAQPKLSPTEELGLRPAEHVIAREVLLKLGVPAEAIQFLGTNVSSTRDEATALKSWAAEHHAQSIIIPTDIFPSRRTRWIFRKLLSEPSQVAPLSVHIIAIDQPRYTRTNWWMHEDGVISFQNEVVKSVYYHLKY